MDLTFMAETLATIAVGIPLTLRLAASSIVLGLALAIVLVAMLRSGVAPLAWVAEAYVFVFRGTPLLVQLFLIYYGLGQFRPFWQDVGLWWILRDPYSCALLALTMNTAAYTSEILRGGLQSVPSGAVEAGRAYGMSGLTLLRRITLPIALRQALPAYGNEVVLMVKATALASTITLMEVMGLAQRINSQTARPIEVLACAGLIYLVINVSLTSLLGLIERRYAPDLARPQG